MIRSFADKEAEKIFNQQRSRKLPQDIQRRARRRLILLDETDQLNDLAVTPSNRFEALKGNRKGQYSIRINRQWRVCFEWQNGDAYNVEIVDYH